MNLQQGQRKFEWALPYHVYTVCWFNRKIVLIRWKAIWTGNSIARLIRMTSQESQETHFDYVSFCPRSISQKLSMNSQMTCSIVSLMILLSWIEIPYWIWRLIALLHPYRLSTATHWVKTPLHKVLPLPSKKKMKTAQAVGPKRNTFTYTDQ